LPRLSMSVLVMSGGTLGSCSEDRLSALFCRRSCRSLLTLACLLNRKSQQRMAENTANRSKQHEPTTSTVRTSRCFMSYDFLGRNLLVEPWRGEVHQKILPRCSITYRNILTLSSTALSKIGGFQPMNPT